MGIDEMISEVADLLVYAAQADGLEDHEIEAACSNARIRDFCKPEYGTVTDAFCQDVRDHIATVLS